MLRYVPDSQWRYLEFSFLIFCDLRKQQPLSCWQIIPTDAIAADNIAKMSMWLTTEDSFADEEFVEFILLKIVSYMLQTYTHTKSKQWSQLRLDS